MDVSAVAGSSGVDTLKRLLYVGPSRTQFEALVRGLPTVDGRPLPQLGEAVVVDPTGRSWAWLPTFDTALCLDALRCRYVNLIVLDLRCFGDAGRFEQQKAQVLDLLDALDAAEDVETRYALDRVLLLISSTDEQQLDRALIEIGARGVRSVLRQGRDDTNGAGAAAFCRRLLERARELIEERRDRRRALCLAAGGITGIYFELGALKCLDDCTSNRAVNTFDMYFGISAGAVVSSFLAVGYSVDELMAAILGLPGRLQPIDMSIFRLANLDTEEMKRRVGVALRALWGLAAKLASGRLLSLENLLLDYSDLVGPVFHTSAFGAMLTSAFEQPGASNDFRQLPSQLFVGATNQDTRLPVLFGSSGYDHVPINQAVEASMAINPAFTPVKIDGRYYEDGAVTRTTGFAEAMRRGAELVLTINPFVPYVSREVGYARKRGVLYTADQNVRTMTYTRFASTRDWMLRRYPHVSSYTFVPQNSLRELLSVSPFDHRPALEIWRGAYLSTLQRLRVVGHRLAGDLAAQGITLDLARAEAVAERLQAAERCRFEDFFPNGEIAIAQTPLCCEAEHPKRLLRRQLSAA